MKLPVLTPLFALATLLAACSSTPLPPEPTAATKPAAPATGTTAATPTSGAKPAPTTTSTVTAVVLPPHKDANNALVKERSVYFDFDEFIVRPQFNALVERHGKYLLQNAALQVRIEGNADERGSAEYNLALGQKRAEAVLRMLKLNGARDSQVEAVSYGKEKPRATGHDEAAWAENRRADVAYR
ncbi:MAG: peptidoglycan-associated lipoprotein Pal [Burkholderiales bacterium]|nr:peptidoglycan-associated lipoprotein Pal [Burkholderiales bacterium]